jgi:hypothetical protein
VLSARVSLNLFPAKYPQLIPRPLKTAIHHLWGYTCGEILQEEIIGHAKIKVQSPGEAMHQMLMYSVKIFRVVQGNAALG